MKELRKRFPFVEEGLLLSKLIAYCSKEVCYRQHSFTRVRERVEFFQAHSSVEKACMISMVKLRILETDSKFRLRGETVRNAIQVTVELSRHPNGESVAGRP